MKTKTALILAASLFFVMSWTLFAGVDDDVDVVPAYTPATDLNPSPVKLPPVKEKTLKNGLRVYFIQQDELPIVSVRLLVPNGELYNPMDEPGIVSFMADLLREGTGKRNSTEISEAIDFVGGTLSSGAGWNAVYIQSSVLSRDLELALDLVSDCAMNAVFPEEEIERQRPQVISGIMESKDYPSEIASREFNRFVYGDHPYGLPSEGTIESVKAFTRDDLLAQYKRLLTPDQAILAISGDFKRKSTDKLVRKYFGGWQERGTELETVGDPLETEGGQILLVDKDDAVQSEIRMGYVLSPYNMGDDYYAYKIMEYIFGSGGFSSRLMLRIRNDLGLTYDVRSVLAARQRKGAFLVSSATKNESTGQLIGEVFDLMRKTIDEGFTEKEVQDAKAYLVGRYPARFETPGQIASQFQSALMFGWDDPAKFISSYRERVAKTTLQEVNAMAKKYLRPDSIKIVVVGKAAEIREQLTPFGTVTEVKMDDL